MKSENILILEKTIGLKSIIEHIDSQFCKIHNIVNTIKFVYCAENWPIFRVQLFLGLN